MKCPSLHFKSNRATILLYLSCLYVFIKFIFYQVYPFPLNSQGIIARSADVEETHQSVAKTEPLSDTLFDRKHYFLVGNQ